MKNTLLTLLAATLPLTAQAEQTNNGDFNRNLGFKQPVSNGNFEAMIGHMFQDNRNYLSVRLNGAFYQDHAFKHMLGAELMFYSKEIDPSLGVDMDTTTLALNYTLEFDPNSITSLYVGVGGGFQYHNLDSDFGSLDSDSTGYAQFFAGARFALGDSADLKVGVRRMFLDDINIFGVQNLDPGHQWALEAGVTFRF